MRKRWGAKSAYFLKNKCAWITSMKVPLSSRPNRRSGECTSSPSIRSELRSKTLSTWNSRIMRHQKRLSSADTSRISTWVESSKNWLEYEAPGAASGIGTANAHCSKYSPFLFESERLEPWSGPKSQAHACFLHGENAWFSHPRSGSAPVAQCPYIWRNKANVRDDSSTVQIWFRVIPFVLIVVMNWRTIITLSLSIHRFRFVRTIYISALRTWSITMNNH